MTSPAPPLSSHRPLSFLGPAFGHAYLANTSLMIAVSMLFRYADFVTYLGGTEYELGWIVGVGMLGALLMRAVLGAGIDRYGASNIWVASVALVVLSLVGHLWIDRLDSPLIYLLRILYTVSLAGAFGASITFVSLRAPASRTGEVIGSLGSSGFVGMALGPLLADGLFAQSAEGRVAVDRLFLVAAGFGLVSLWAKPLAPARMGASRHTALGVVGRCRSGGCCIAIIPEASCWSESRWVSPSAFPFFSCDRSRPDWAFPESGAFSWSMPGSPF